MVAVSARRTLLPLSLVVGVYTAAHAQAAAPAPSGATAAWTLRMKGDIRWQQVTPAGALLVSTDGALSGVDIERGVVTWEKPELGGLPADSVRIVEGSLLVEAARPGLDIGNHVLVDDYTHNFTGMLREELYGRPGIQVGDIDFAEIYDCFTSTVLMGGTRSPAVISRQLLAELAEVIPNVSVSMLSGLDHLAPQQRQAPPRT